MFFETEKFKVELANVEDAYEIAEVYNSNKTFLMNHIGKDKIDVVTNYDANVFKFWSSNGFTKFKDIKLSWKEKELPAVIMKKEI